MQWKPLIHFASHDYFKPKLDRLTSEVNEEFTKLEEARQAFDAKVAELRSAAVEGIDFDNLIGAPQLQMEAATLLQEEIRVRKRWLEVLPQVREARRKASEELDQLDLKTREDVRQRLLSIGFLDLPLGQIGAIQPLFVQAHPEVVGLVHRRRAVGNQDSALQEHQRAHEEAIEEAQTKLARLRDRASAL